MDMDPYLTEWGYGIHVPKKKNPSKVMSMPRCTSKPTWKRVGMLRALAMAAGGLCVGGMAVLVALQRKLLYVPVLPGAPREYVARPEDYELACDDAELVAEDGTKLHAWFLRASDGSPARATVVFFQENAGNISHRLPFARALVHVLHVHVLLLSYRGYGASEGTPTEAGLKQDAGAAMAYVLGRKDVDPKRVVVMGKSLGGAVAIHAATQHPVAALVVENTFTSVNDMAATLLPPLRRLVASGKPLERLCFDRWKNVDAIRKVNVPTLMLSSRQDEIVPSVQMRNLYASAMAADAKARERFRFVEMLQSHHMDAYVADADLYWGTLHKFLDEVLL